MGARADWSSATASGSGGVASASKLLANSASSLAPISVETTPGSRNTQLRLVREIE